MAITETFFPVHFAQPLWLLALSLAALPPVIALFARRRGKAVSAGSIFLQCLAATMAACALAQPSIPAAALTHKPWLVLQDASASVRGQPAQMPDWPANLKREQFLFARYITRVGEHLAGGGDGNATFITPALELASGSAGQASGVLVFTDGQFQDADWPQAAAAAGRLGLPVYIVPLDSPLPDARVVQLLARRRPDGRAELSAGIVSNAVQKRTVIITRRQGRKELLRKELILLPDEPAEVHVLDDAPGAGATAYEVRLLGQDAFGQNDSAQALLSPLWQHVALVGRDVAPLAAVLPELLKTPVTSLLPEQLPLDADGWMNYSAVLLVDADGSLLSSAGRAMLERYVREGGGLVLMGAGPYTSPADRDDPLNRISALSANPYQRKPMRAVVVLDASGSMSEMAGGAESRGQSKFELACQAVLSLQRHLTRADSLAVVIYSDSCRMVYDSKSGPPDFGALRDALAGVIPSGPTHVMPALALAAQSPVPEGKAGVVLLASDLLTEPYDASEVARVETLFSKGRYELSVAAVKSAQSQSQPAKTSLEALSEHLKAQRLACDDLRGLADVFGRFLRSSRGQAVQAGRFSPRLESGAMGFAGLKLPELDSYILCAPLEQSQVLGWVGSDPLLARRQVGLGRSVSLAVPMGAGANAALLQNPAAGQLLAASLRWAGREQPDGRFAGRIEKLGDRLRVTVDAADANGPMNLLELSVTVLDVPGQTQEAVSPGSAKSVNRVDEVPRVLRQTRPGEYQLEIDAPVGPFEVVVKRLPGERAVFRQTLGQNCPAEFAAIGPNWGNLRRLAELTGGRLVSLNQLPALSAAWNRDRFTPIWFWLLAAAVLLVLADWILGRVLRKT